MAEHKTKSPQTGAGATKGGGGKEHSNKRDEKNGKQLEPSHSRGKGGSRGGSE